MTKMEQPDLPGTSQWGHKNEHISGIRDKGVHGQNNTKQKEAEKAGTINGDSKKKESANPNKKDPGNNGWTPIEDVRVPSWEEMNENREQDGPPQNKLVG